MEITDTLMDAIIAENDPDDVDLSYSQLKNCQ
jgi:hypothetical protein